MQQQARAITLGVARLAAVLFALGVLSYLVVTAQRRAGASQSSPEGGSVTDSLGAAVVGAQSAPGQGGGTPATSLPADTQSANAVDAEVFLFGSKSMPLESMPGTPSDTFLSTSKSGVIDLTQQLAPATPPKPADPVFLPSSKFRTLAPLPAAVAKPANPAFLHSSKSLRLAPVPAAPAKPAAPARVIE